MTHDNPTITLAEAALSYGERGWHIFPVVEQGKTPAVKSWTESATNDLDRIGRHWAKRPEHNIGIACGPSQLIVVDVDDLDAVGRLTLDGFELPRTLAAETGGGGCHYFYTAPAWPLRNTAGKLPGAGDRPGIDLRASGGYVIAPPSLHKSGHRYWWLGWEDQPAPCPAWLRDPEPKPTASPFVPLGGFSDAYMTAALEREADKIRYASIGTRNHLLNIGAFNVGQFLPHGQDIATAVGVLLRAALEAGLPEDASRETIRSGLKAGSKQPRGTTS